MVWGRDQIFSFSIWITLFLFSFVEEFLFCHQPCCLCHISRFQRRTHLLQGSLVHSNLWHYHNVLITQAVWCWSLLALLPTALAKTSSLSRTFQSKWISFSSWLAQSQSEIHLNQSASTHRSWQVKNLILSGSTQGTLAWLTLQWPGPRTEHLLISSTGHLCLDDPNSSGHLWRPRQYPS